jgi:molybdopterin-containing oxidoreductase family iron-sulfur binding subunit
MNNDLGKMVLNPDVVVRSRGVMEKCSMCVQRLQEGKLNAKKAGRPIKEGEINTACAQTCPTNAITFGDYKLKGSALSELWKPEERSYHLLGELNVQPNVFYLTKVRNIEEGKEA